MIFDSSRLTQTEIDFQREVFNQRFVIIKPTNNGVENHFAEEVIHGLLSDEKTLNPKYFYNAKGSRLFEDITKLKEYYPTRTEASILKNISSKLPGLNSDLFTIVEIGSGNSEKTKYLLDTFSDSRNVVYYSPIDISDIVIKSGKHLTHTYQNLFIEGIIAEYESGLEIAATLNDQPKLFLFLGSSIGNFTYSDSIAFLQMVRSNMQAQDRLLVGFDMIKDKNILEAAYNDKEGVTAEFNMNILERINSELEGNFNLETFRHFAFFNEKKSRIEMHLISKSAQEITISGCDQAIHFEANESIHTENSYKYTPEMIQELSRKSDLEIEERYTDDKNYFTLYLFKTN